MSNDAVTSVPALKRFKCLSAKLESATSALSAAHTDCDTPQSQLNKFMLQIKELQQHPDAVAFWQEHRATYSCLADTALDFVAAPASQAYVEQVFFRFVACSLKGAATECLNAGAAEVECEADWLTGLADILSAVF